MDNNSAFNGTTLPKLLQDYTLRNLYENRFHYPGNDLDQLGLLLTRWFNCKEKNLISMEGNNYQLVTRYKDSTLTYLLIDLSNNTKKYTVPLSPINEWFIATYLT